MDLLVGFGLGISDSNAVIFRIALLPPVVGVGAVGLSLYAILAALVALLWLTVAAMCGGPAGRLRAALGTEVGRRRVRRFSGVTMFGAGALVAAR